MSFRPYRPRLVAAANGVGRGLGALGVRAPLSAAGLIARARRRARLEDFGSPAIEAPLERMVTAIEAEARLHPVGRMITKERLTGVLTTRLRIQELLSRTPALREAPVAPLLVVTGLQRTGTTLLQRLLSSDPRCRPLRSFEALEPVPPAHASGGPKDPRRKRARTAERALRYLAPQFFAIHPVEAEGTEEDSILLDLSLYSPVAEATLRVPSYAGWLAEQDMRPAYLYLQTVLRILQAQQSGQWWVLKTPAHLPFLDVLLDVFPDTVIVHTHRDPKETVASYCSMIAHGRGVFSDHIDAEELGQELLAQQSHMVHAAMRSRAEDAIDARVLDVSYRDLVADPLATAATIYERLGRPLTPEARDAMQATLRGHRKDRFGRHRYQLEDFGLADADVTRAFAPYLSAHPEVLG